MSPTPPAGPHPPDPALPAGAAPAAGRPAIQEAAEHLAAGRPTEAADALARLVAGAPTYAAAHVLHAVALEADGRPAEALAAWHRAAFLVPRSPLVQRERQRLTAAAAEAAPPAPAAPAPEDAPVTWGPVADAPPVSEPAPLESTAAETVEPAADEAPPDWAVSDDAVAGDAVADDADLPSLQTLPLGDLTLPAGSEGDVDSDGFDPDGFDFSAFDTDDDGEAPDWLTGGPVGDEPGLEPLAPAPPARAEVDEPTLSAWHDDEPPRPPPVADWADDLSDEAVRLMPPEGDSAATHRPAEAEAEWAVFEDEPPPPPSGPVRAGPGSPGGSIQWDRPAGSPGAPEGDPGRPVAPAPSSVDDLDSLIADLENAPRIRPDPTFSGPPAATATATSAVDEMVSETLAKIYAAQHQYVEAALVYEKLAAREPDRAAAMLEQAAEMRRRRA